MRALLRLIVALALSAAPAAHAQDINATGTLVADAPVFIMPDSTRVPLATLPAGTTLKVLSKEDAWYKVVFHDSQWGDRTGYTLAANVRVDAAPPAPAQSRTAAAPRAGQPANEPSRSTANAGDAAGRLHERPAYRGIISLNGAYQGTSTAFTGATTFPLNAETGNVTTSYAGAHPIVVDIGGTERVWRAVGITLAATWSSHTGGGVVSASLPHPFAFNAARTVSGAATGLKRQETAVHVDPSLLVPMGRAHLVIFGGPSYFRVKQGLVTGVDSTDVYPYDTATFVGAQTVDLRRSHVGFNGGFDLTVGISKAVGVGALARYSRATLAFSEGDNGSVRTRVGGMQAGGGLRFRF